MDDLVAPVATSTSKAAEYVVYRREEVTLEVQAFTVLVLAMLLVLALLLAVCLRKMRCRVVQDGGAAILLGASVGFVFLVFHSVDKVRSVLIFDREFFFLVLLPAIVYNAGLHMNSRAFFRNIGAILSFAFVGTLFSAAVMACLLMLVNKLVFVPQGFAQVGWTEALLFGCVMAATDTVTVLSIFSSLGVDANLHAYVFGESSFNDAVAIVLYRSVLTFDIKGISPTTCVLVLAQFVFVFLGSLVVGVLFGVLSSLLFKFADFHRYPAIEASVLLFYAYSGYVLAEGLGLSGIVGILFTGIVNAHYTKVFPSLSFSFLFDHFFFLFFVRVFFCFVLFFFRLISLSAPSTLSPTCLSPSPQ